MLALSPPFAALYSEEFGLTHEEVSAQIGKDRTTITNQIRLLKLPDEAKRALIEGEITAGHARAILSVETLEERMAILKSIRSQNLSVRKTESLIRKISGTRKTSKEPEEENPYVKQIADELKRELSTQVRIIYNKGKGKIEIEYYSDEELERLSSMLLEKITKM